jgi:hypothetical membrane protein
MKTLVSWKGKLRKIYGFSGIFAPLLFLMTYTTISFLRPNFSHLTKAVSELGSIGAPYMWWWNIFGYILPGAMIAIFAIGLREELNREGSRNIAFAGLFLSGLFMSVSGIFPGDFANRSSLTMIFHAVGSFGSFVFFLISAFALLGQFRKSDYWRKVIIPSLILAVLSFLSGFMRTGEAPGLGQRIGFFFYFAWVAYLAVALLNRGSRKNQQA